MDTPDPSSPLPWSIDEDDDILDADGMYVPVHTHSNIRLIVTAVNSHVDLLAAAKDALDSVNDGDRYQALFDAVLKAEGIAS
jgi:hypothetical protein